MRQLVITSGKGGTGKTTVAACFITLAWRAGIADADVDAPNLHLILHPKVLEDEEFRGAKKAVKKEEACTGCGRCEEACRFGAISHLTIDPLRCEGCGVCVYVCPEQAISLEEVATGRLMLSRTRYGRFAHARLYIGAEASGKLVTAVRRKAEAACEYEELIIVDGSPGIGCAVIASLSGTDLALVVTEPSASGLHDLERILGVARHFGVSALVCINKCDLSLELSEEIERYCLREGVELAGKIPFDPEVVKVIREGMPIEELLNTRAGQAIGEIWETVRRRLQAPAHFES
ncbi:MAG: ATP-binding protein [Thermacetogeniaceae bacterium]